MRQIPKNMLIDEAVIRTPASEDCFGTVTYGSDTTLRYIRIDFSEKLAYGGMRCGDKSEGRLFYDCRNSLPRDFSFSVGQVIDYGGKSYRVIAVKKLYEKKRLHHIEVVFL